MLVYKDNIKGQHQKEMSLQNKSRTARCRPHPRTYALFAVCKNMTQTLNSSKHERRCGVLEYFIQPIYLLDILENDFSFSEAETDKK